MSVPPCELAHGLKAVTTDTIVAKMEVGGLSGLLWDWATSEVVVGAGGCAVVDLPCGNTRLAKATATSTAVYRMKAMIEQLPGSPQVAWARPLNRRHQRLFGWGDVGASDADLARAVAAHDVEELAVLLPQSADMLRRGHLDWKHMPALLSVS